MLKKSFALPNTVAITTGIVYLSCALSVLIFPDFSLNIAKTWFHGMDITKISATNITLPSFLTGLVSSVIYAWFIGFVFAKTHDWMNK